MSACLRGDGRLCAARYWGLTSQEKKGCPSGDLKTRTGAREDHWPSGGTDRSDAASAGLETGRPVVFESNTYTAPSGSASAGASHRMSLFIKAITRPSLFILRSSSQDMSKRRYRRWPVAQVIRGRRGVRAQQSRGQLTPSQNIIISMRQTGPTSWCDSGQESPSAALKCGG